MGLRHETRCSFVAVDMDLGHGGFDFCLRWLGVRLDPLVIPLLKNILLQGHHPRHDAVLVEIAKGDFFTDPIVDMFMCQVCHFLLGVLRDVLATEGLLDCLE